MSSFEIKVSDLVAADQNGKPLVVDALNALVRERLTMPIAFRLNKIISQVSPEIKSFFELKQKLVQENGSEIKDSNGASVGFKTDDDKTEKVIKELTDAANISVTIHGDKFNLEDFAETKISCVDCAAIAWLIKE